MGNELLNYDKGYSKIPNKLLRAESNLTITQTCIVVYLLSHAEGYKISINTIKKDLKAHFNTIKENLIYLFNNGFQDLILERVELFNNELEDNNKVVQNRTTRIIEEEYKKKEINKENIIKSGNNSNTLVAKKATSNKEAKQQTFSKVKTKNSATLAIDSLPINITNDFTKLGLEIVKYLDLEAEYQQFRNHYIIKGYKIRDWLFKWQSWLNKAVEYGKDVQTSLTLMHKEQQMDTFVTILSDDEVLKAKSETKQEYKRNKQLQEALHTYFNAKCTQLDLFSKEKYQQLFSKYRKRPFLVLSNGKEYQEIEKFINNTEQYDEKIAFNLDKELLNEPLPNTKEFKDDWKQRAINTCKEFNIDCSELLNENFDLNSFSNDMHNAFMKEFRNA